MDLKIIYEDENMLAIDKPAGLVVFHEGNHPSTDSTSSLQAGSGSLINELINEKPELKTVGEAPRYGIVHRLDKDTSGVILVAKTQKALIFLQKQFKNREVSKKYLALATGTIKDDAGQIHTFIGRSPQNPKKQKAYSLTQSAPPSAREAISHYKVLQRFADYTLLEVSIETGRKHQIRCHLAFIHHPVAGDTLYGFKDSPRPNELTRQFLHASYIKIELPACAGRPSGQVKELHSDLPEELQNILNNLKENSRF